MKHNISFYVCSLLLAFCALRNICRIYSSNERIRGKALLLIAHPDDESMFFTPVLYRKKPYILCLSPGDYMQNGSRRRAELGRVCRRLGLRHIILDYKDNEDWSTIDVALSLIEAILKQRISTVITFDMGGVSGHKNHISCCKAARLVERAFGKDMLRFRYLRSASCFEKYVINFHKYSLSVPFYSFFGFRNMLLHRSQMVWFRYIYLTFTNYMSYVYLSQ